MDPAEQPLVLGYTFQGPRKIDLPESVLESLDIATFDESPLIYRITANEHTTFVGVREFSAPEGHYGINAALADHLNLGPGDPLAIERVELPKGTQVTLKASSESIDWKSLLERWLPQNCTALSVGDMLNIDYSGETHQLRVTDLAPQSPVGAAVCIVDTDMDLVVEAEAALATEAPVQLPTLEFNKEIDLGPALVTVSAAVPAGTRELFIRSSEIAYIGPEYATSPTSFLAIASAPGSNDDVVAVSTAFLGSSLSVCGSGSLEIYTEDPHNTIANEASHDGEKLCSNCGRSVPEQSFLLHSNFCARNSVQCPQCKRRFFGMREVPSNHWHCTRCPASGEDNYSYHELKHDLYESGGGLCDCKEFSGITRAELAFHRATSCPLRNHICQFCHLLVPQGETNPVDAAQDLTAHESQCGNRTADCPLCNRPIRLRSLKLHLQDHEQQRRQRKPPLMCSNRNCPNVIRSTDNSPLGLCAPCFGPLSVPGANSDLGRINSRVERRYLLQMTRGCGKSWCQNQVCKTGSGITRSVADSMSQVRQLLEQSEHYFCVDETSTRKAMFVQLDDGIYDRGWRGMAISSCGTEAEASQWLEQNASKLNE